MGGSCRFDLAKLKGGTIHNVHTNNDDLKSFYPGTPHLVWPVKKTEIPSKSDAFQVISGGISMDLGLDPTPPASPPAALPPPPEPAPGGGHGPVGRAGRGGGGGAPGDRAAAELAERATEDVAWRRRETWCRIRIRRRTEVVPGWEKREM